MPSTPPPQEFDPLTLRRIFETFVGFQDLDAAARTIAKATRAYPELFNELSLVLQEGAKRGHEGDAAVVEAVNHVAHHVNTPRQAATLCETLVVSIAALLSR